MKGLPVTFLMYSSLHAGVLLARRVDSTMPLMLLVQPSPLGPPHAHEG